MFKQDPNEAKLVTLTTKCEELEKTLNEYKANTTTSNTHRASTGTTSSGQIQDWRKVKKGASVTKDGVTWWWCPEHRRKGDFDGLYVKHKPEDHAEWAARKEKRKKNDSSSNNGGSSSKKLVLTDKLKSALATKMKMNDTELDDYLKSQGN